MAQCLIGSVFSLRTDKEGECKLTFLIPKSHRDQASEVAKLTEQVVFITVQQEAEVEE